MEERTFSISDVASQAWKTLRSNMWLLASLWLTLLGVIIAGSIITKWLDPIFFHPLGNLIVSGIGNIQVRIVLLSLINTFIFQIPFHVIQSGIGLGIAKVTLDAYDAKNGNYWDLFSQFGIVHRSLGLYVLTMAFTFGIILVPLAAISFLNPLLLKNFFVLTVLTLSIVTVLFYFAFRFSLCLFYLVDKRVGAIESLRKSFRITQGLVWKFFGLFIVITLVSITIIGIPLAYLMLLTAYRKLEQKDQHVPVQ